MPLPRYSPHNAGLSPSLGVAFAILFFVGAAHAQSDQSARRGVTFSGYGTLGVAHSTEDRADFLANDLQGRGAGHSRKWSPDVDSRIGVQVNANFSPQLSAVVQVLAEQRHDASYRPTIEWANLKYEFTPDFSIRAGRIVLPGFMASNYKKVGYAQPWVRPPVEVYGLIPVSRSDGIDMSYRMRMGQATHNFQIAYGGTSAGLPEGGKATIKDGWLISDTVEYGAATLHMAYARSKVTLDSFRPLFDGYRQFAGAATQAATMLPPGFRPAVTAAAAQATAIANKYDPDHRQLSFISIGGSYDPGDWFAMAEWGQTDSDSIFGKRAAWYATGGYRWGKFTPYVSYAVAKLKSNQRDAGITGVPALLPALQGAAATLNANLNDQLAGAPTQKTISIGTRWDFAKNAALKLQYDHSRVGNGSTGTLDRPQPGFVLGGRFNVFSATVDFVF